MKKEGAGKGEGVPWLQWQHEAKAGKVTPFLDKGAASTDAETHVIEYAIRVPARNSTSRNIWNSTSTNFPFTSVLRESLAYQTPLRAIFTENPPEKSLGGNTSGVSIAAVLAPNCAYISTAKLGTLNSSQIIFRVVIPCKSGWYTEQSKVAVSKMLANKNTQFYLGTALEVSQRTEDNYSQEIVEKISSVDFKSSTDWVFVTFVASSALHTIIMA